MDDEFYELRLEKIKKCLQKALGKVSSVLNQKTKWGYLEDALDEIKGAEEIINKIIKAKKEVKE